MNNETLYPERPVRGEDHLFHYPDVPTPPPITSVNAATRSLIVVPSELAMTEPFRGWLRAFIRTRHRTTTGKAGRPGIDIAVDADAQLRAAVAARKKKPGPWMRGLRRPRNHDEVADATHAYSEARHDLEHFLRSKHLPDGQDVQGFQMVSTEIRLAPLGPQETPERIVLPAEMYSRIVGGRYDEIVYLGEKRHERRLVRLYARNPWAWVGIFENLPKPGKKKK